MKNIIRVSIVLVLVFLAGCTSPNITEQKEKTMVEKKDDAMMQKTGATGKLLAGTATEYREFTKAEYDQALQEGKTILLYFYANWCPLCKSEQKDTFAAFNEISNQNIIGFRVNYKDSDTDADEEALAKEFGISYQHTKVILKNGQRVLKAPDSWDKARYLEELQKVA